MSKAEIVTGDSQTIGKDIPLTQANDDVISKDNKQETDSQNLNSNRESESFSQFHDDLINSGGILNH